VGQSAQLRQALSARERSRPRFCFKPRSMASCSESGITPGTTFVGTLPANGFGLLEADVETVCATDRVAPQIKRPTQRKRGGAPPPAIQRSRNAGPELFSFMLSSRPPAHWRSTRVHLIYQLHVFCDQSQVPVLRRSNCDLPKNFVSQGGFRAVLVSRHQHCVVSSSVYGPISRHAVRKSVQRSESG
jgi:hypothetical protein